jgi:2-haloacid dehalogenase
MKHQLFLFDLDDTLLDFRASEKLSFVRTMRDLGLRDDVDGLFHQYQAINVALWRQFESGAVSKDFLKVERFRQTFAANGPGAGPEAGQ